MPSKGKQRSKPRIEVKESRGFVIGDFATVINNFWDEKILKRFGLEQRAGFIILLLAVLGVGAGLYFALRPYQPEVMSGDFRIAIASFYVKGSNPQKQVGYDLADTVRQRMEQDLKEINPELVIPIWGPERVGTIRGDTIDERARQAAKIASQIHADMVVYGVIDTDQDNWQVLPEFYISAENFYEAREVVGQNDLGSPIKIAGIYNTVWRYEFGKQMFARGKALSVMSVGLGYFALHQYDKALASFQTGQDIPDWNDNQGKKVLYTMTAFAAGKVGEARAQDKQPVEAEKNFDLAEHLLKEAIAMDAEYSRPYIGLANLNYMRALQQFNVSNNPQDIDIKRLQECYVYLDKAQAATNKPPQADAETKIHFARGQCLMMDVYSRHTKNLAPAIQEFEQVIRDFGDGANPRIQELAAEAHGRLALIDWWLGKNDLAVQEYDTAASLLPDYPDRRDLFLEYKAKAAK